MDKDRHTIAATEFSKFAYCPYQWYYERVYGRSELRRLERERNERLGLDDSRKERLEEGVSYHRNVYKAAMKGRRRAVFALIIITAAVLYFLIKGGSMI